MRHSLVCILAFVILGSVSIRCTKKFKPSVVEVPQVNSESLCPMLNRSAAEIHQPLRPFSETSIWNRRIASIGADPESAWGDVSAAIWGDPNNTPTQVTPDLVSICYVDATKPLTNISKSQGWNSFERSQSSSTVLYQRNLSAEACGCTSWNPIGNALFVVIDPVTQLADVGVGGWRILGGPLLQVAPDGNAAHNIDISTGGDGIVGSSRASSLPPLGGLIRPGELVTGINHAVAIALPFPRFYYGGTGFIWPAQSADEIASTYYLGSDPNYRLGTLLAIKSTINLSTLAWKTSAGYNLAVAAQTYGLYIVDNSIGEVSGHAVAIAFEDEAARFDLGLTIDPASFGQSVDESLFDASGFNDDVIQILQNVFAVTGNH